MTTILLLITFAFKTGLSFKQYDSAEALCRDVSPDDTTLILQVQAKTSNHCFPGQILVDDTIQEKCIQKFESFTVTTATCALVKPEPHWELRLGDSK